MVCTHGLVNGLIRVSRDGPEVNVCCAGALPPHLFPEEGKGERAFGTLFVGSDFIRSPNRIRVFFHDQNKVNSLITLSNFTWVEPLLKDLSGRLQKELWLSRVETAKW